MGNNEKEKNAGISNLQGILSIFVLVIHAASGNINVPGSDLQSIHGMNYSSFIQMFLSEGVCRVAVPCFFMISGYLFYKSFDGSLRKYLKKNEKRIHTLLIPYLIWSALVYFAFMIAQRIPALSGYFTTRNDDSLSFYSILHNIVLNPYNSPMWYLQYLIMFSIISIVLYPVYKYIPVFIIAILFYGWFSGFAGIEIHIPFRMDAVFFYSLGAVTGVHQNKLKNVFIRMGKMRSIWICSLLIIYILLLIYHSWELCLKPNSFLLEGEYDLAIDISGKIGIILGSFLILWFFLANPSNHEWPWVKHSFLLFVIHHPIVNTIKKIIIKMLGGTLSSSLSLITYITSAMLTFAIVIGFGTLLREKWPDGNNVLVGDR